MISLTIKFLGKEQMEEWIDDVSDLQIFPVPVSYRQEDYLDKPDERYVLCSKRESDLLRGEE